MNWYNCQLMEILNRYSRNFSMDRLAFGLHEIMNSCGKNWTQILSEDTSVSCRPVNLQIICLVSLREILAIFLIIKPLFQLTGNYCSIDQWPQMFTDTNTRKKLNIGPGLPKLFICILPLFSGHGASRYKLTNWTVLLINIFTSRLYKL